MDIYTKINNHKMMTNEDIINIVDDRLKKLNLYKKRNNVKFSNDKDLYFRYGPLEKKVYVSNNYKKLLLRPLLRDNHIKAVTQKQEKSTFFTDFYNLELLIAPYHEVRHSEQHNKIIDYIEDYNILINKSLCYMGDNYRFYDKNHPRFLSEHDAELSALMLILSDIEKGKLNVCKNAIYLFNIYIAYFLLRSRGFVIENKELKRNSIFKSPLHLLYFYNKSLYLKKEIDKEEYEEVNHSILKIHKQNQTEYDRIISGDSLSDETINELFLIEKGIIKTENIFKYFENKQLDKNNNHYVKKLILSKE